MTDPIQRVIARYWNSRASTYDAVGLHTPETDDELRAWTRIRGLLAPVSCPSDVLDVGCGTGFLALLFAEAGHRVTGCDLSPAMIEEARRKAAARGLKTTFVVNDAEGLNAPDQSFDLVVSRQLFWTLPHPDQALREWVRVTRPGGRVAVIDDEWTPGPRGGGGSDPYEHELIGTLPYLQGGVAADEVAVLMRRAGLADITFDPLEDRIAAEQVRLAALGRATSVYARYLVYGRRVR
ncbi:MAG: class I SAM-dependent methyltransferase [Dehalococcoidia bacterium]